MEGKLIVRMFLSVFMISIYPNEVFEKGEMVPIQKTMMEAAVQLCIRFERILRTLVQQRDFKRVPAELTVNLVPTLAAFMNSFVEWKRSDEKRMAQRFEEALHALEDCLASTTIQSDDPEHARTRLEIEEQIRKLREKFGRLSGGSAMLEQYDAKRRKMLLARPQRCCTPASNEQYAHELFLNPFFQLDTENLDLSNSNARQNMEKVRGGIIISFSKKD